MPTSSAGNINAAFGAGGDVEDLCDLADRYGYSLRDDELWRETDDDPGLTDEQMWQYVWDRRESDLEDLCG